MILGFNNDIRHRGKTFHVQTEDSGPQNPVITTHVFIGGTILGTKRTEYKDDLGRSDLNNHVRALMQKQHREMMKAVQYGEYDDAARRPRRQSPARDIPLARDTASLGPASPVPTPSVDATLIADTFPSGLVVEHTPPSRPQPPSIPQTEPATERTPPPIPPALPKPRPPVSRSKPPSLPPSLAGRRTPPPPAGGGKKRTTLWPKSRPRIDTPGAATDSRDSRSRDEPGGIEAASALKAMEALLLKNAPKLTTVPAQADATGLLPGGADEMLGTVGVEFPTDLVAGEPFDDLLVGYLIEDVENS